jgi:hypothetical protein
MRELVMPERKRLLEALNVTLWGDEAAGEAEIELFRAIAVSLEVPIGLGTENPNPEDPAA